MSDTRSGQCLCGAVKFTVKPKIEDDGIHVDACHCAMCRRQVGGPLMGLNLSQAPQVENPSALVTYQSSQWAERQFCGTCGSNLFYRLRDGSMFTVSAGALDDLSGGKLTMEIFIDEKPDYYDFAQPTKKLTGAQVMSLFAGGGQEG